MGVISSVVVVGIPVEEFSQSTFVINPFMIFFYFGDAIDHLTQRWQYLIMNVSIPSMP